MLRRVGTRRTHRMTLLMLLWIYRREGKVALRTRLRDQHPRYKKSKKASDLCL